MPQAVAETARVLARGGRLCMAIVHPLSSAGSFERREATAPFVITGSYLDSAPVTWMADRGGIKMTFPSEHRPLQAYTGALEAAGMLIEAVREVRPTDELIDRDPNERRWLRFPFTSHPRGEIRTTARMSPGQQNPRIKSLTEARSDRAFCRVRGFARHVVNL